MRRRAFALLVVAVCVLALPGNLFARSSSRATGLPLPCGLLLPCPPPPPPPPPTPTPPPTPSPPGWVGGHFDGHAGRWRAWIGISRDGKQLTSAAVEFISGRCSNGERFGSGLGRKVHVPIAPNGNVRLREAFRHAYWFDRSGHRVYGREALSIALHVAGDRVTGSFVDRFHSRQFSCRSRRVHIFAYRDGTPQAPLVRGQVATGAYRYPVGEIGMEPSMRVYLPQQEITQMRFTWTLVCPGRGYPQHFHLVEVPIHYGKHGPVFFQHASGEVHGRGLVQRYRWRLSGRFYHRGPHNRADGAYYASGRWWSVLTVYRGHKKLATCHSSPNSQFVLDGPHG
jgi:hypothetical protein